MVNGKPNLVFGGTPTPASAPTRKGKSKTSPSGMQATNFASYLPLNEHGSQNKTGKTQNIQPTAQPGNSQAYQPKNAPPPNAKMYLGHLPDNYISGSVQSYGQKQAGDNARQAKSLPAGKNTHAQARQQGRPGEQGMWNTYAAQDKAILPQHIANRNAPRISSQRPITGRGNSIGMVDTRKTAGARSTLTGRGALGYASPNANAAQAQSLGMTDAPYRAGSFAPPGSDTFAQFSAYYGGISGPVDQSFVTHGFASRNGELALKKMGYDVRENRSIKTYAQKLEPDPYSLRNNQAALPGTTIGITKPLERVSGDDGARTRVLAGSHRKKGDPESTRAYPATSLVKPFYASADNGLGYLAAKFESGSEGIAAIGYDRTGGTSYGKYQIASRVGTMRAFISYLHTNAPDLAKRLEAAGPANTGSRNGRMPTEWRKIAAEDPQRFENLQSDFIRTSHFEPAMQSITASTGVSFEGMPKALQEVLFSTAVQHGPAGASRIVNQALRRVGPEKLAGKGPGKKKAEEQLITHIYNLRAGQFRSSTARIQSAARSRMHQEMREAIQMLS